jgi:hypothetical protein
VGSKPYIELATLLGERQQMQIKAKNLEQRLSALFANFQQQADELMRVFFTSEQQPVIGETEFVMFGKLGLPGYLLYPIVLMQAHSLSDKAVFHTLLPELPGKKLQGKNETVVTARLVRRARGLLSAANGKRRARFVASLLSYLKNELAMGNDRVVAVFGELSKVYTKYTGIEVGAAALLQEAGY